MFQGLPVRRVHRVLAAGITRRQRRCAVCAMWGNRMTWLIRRTVLVYITVDTAKSVPGAPRLDALAVYRAWQRADARKMPLAGAARPGWCMRPADRLHSGARTMQAMNRQTGYHGLATPRWRATSVALKFNLAVTSRRHAPLTARESRPRSRQTGSISRGNRLVDSTPSAACRHDARRRDT
jgi:hypothetical protein